MNFSEMPRRLEQFRRSEPAARFRFEDQQALPSGSVVLVAAILPPLLTGAVFPPEPTDVNAVIDRALHLIEIPDNVRMDVMLKDNLDCAMIDGDQIRQVFLNIILNALQSMPHGGMLKIETCRREMFIEAKFTDTGCGIEKEHIDKIFEPLFTTKDNGAGLGLAVTKAIVDKHDGKIEMESERGRGTTCVVKLPAA